MATQSQIRSYIRQARSRGDDSSAAHWSSELRFGQRSVKSQKKKTMPYSYARPRKRRATRRRSSATKTAQVVVIVKAAPRRRSTRRRTTRRRSRY